MSLNKSLFFEKDILTTAPIIQNRYNQKFSMASVDTYIIATSENNSIQVCSGLLTTNFKNWLSSYSTHKEKENLYITAIENLWKKIDYLQLSNQYDQNQISEEEYISELEKNENCYMISPNENFSIVDYHIAVGIVHKITCRNFEEHEMAEMFSIPLDRLDNIIIEYEELSQHKIEK